MSTLFGSGINSSTGGIASGNSDPKWFQDTKKRIITNHLVPRRKAGLQVAATTAKGGNKKDTKNTKNLLGLSSEDNEYNILSFGVSQRKALTTGSSLDIYDTSSGNLLHDTANESLAADFNLYNNNDDLPPSRSIYDLNDDVLISFNKPTNQNTDSFINKNPKNYNNAFSQFDDSNEPSKIATKDKEPIHNPLDHSESAVLIFGYHESMVNQVIGYFLELGTILEPFEVNKNANNNNARFLFNETSQDRKKVYPIFSGESWVKITYDNPSSAIDALQENGNVFNGAIIGVVPYTKDTVEKLQKRTLSANEDIGGGIELSKNIEHPNAKSDSVTGLMSDSNDIAYVKRVDIKDGTGFFLKATNNAASDPTKTEAEKKNDEKLGVVGKTFKFLFGFNEL